MAQSGGGGDMDSVTVARLIVKLRLQAAPAALTGPSSRQCARPNCAPHSGHAGPSPRVLVIRGAPPPPQALCPEDAFLSMTLTRRRIADGTLKASVPCAPLTGPITVDAKFLYHDLWSTSAARGGVLLPARCWHLRQLWAALFYAAEILSAIGYLPQPVHHVPRDLQCPRTCLLDVNGHLKITDFGFAKVCGEDPDLTPMCGTPEYLGRRPRTRRRGHPVAPLVQVHQLARCGAAPVMKAAHCAGAGLSPPATRRCYDMYDEHGLEEGPQVASPAGQEHFKDF
uniref:Protein kinase domain-containing protein n=1 Tax=Macrostomum lignano TaxID=282301 RepID=A0A1I8ISY5_9PLAT